MAKRKRSVIWSYFDGKGVRQSQYVSSLEKPAHFHYHIDQVLIFLFPASQYWHHIGLVFIAIVHPMPNPLALDYLDIGQF